MKTTATGSRSDFLSTVIDRAHGRAHPGAPLVAPRPASLFEPAATSIAEAAESEAAFVPARAAPRLDVPLAHEPLPPSMPPHAAKPVRDTAPPSLSSATPQIVHAQHFHIAAEASRLHTQPFAAEPTLALPASMPRIAPVHDDVAATAPRAAPEAVAESRRDNAVVPRIDVPEPRVAAALPSRDVVAAFAAHAPALASPTRDVTAFAATPAAPVVTISIGRVDVRAPAATPAAARAAAAQQRPAALSDYLGRKERVR